MTNPPSSAASSRENVVSVYRRIRRMILTGKLESGQVLSQVQLANEFETSRGPIREALRMLQREGLIEAETNQQGRIVTFTAEDLEQVCALLALNVTTATRMGAEQFTGADIRAITLVVDRIEGLAADHTVRNPRHAAMSQLAFRKLIRLTCQYAGPFIAQTIDELLDRVAIFRQMYELGGDATPYPHPLASGFPNFKDAATTRDADAMALVLLDKIADVSRQALRAVAPRYEPRLLNMYINAARTSFGGGASVAMSEDATALTIRVHARPGSRIAYEISDA